MKLVLSKISLITPSFNQAQYLEQTINSVLSQDYPNLEYIIIDGGSTDGSVDIIKKHEKHLAYWVSEKDNGQSHAINKGIKKATGEIINWLNSDDFLEPGTLANLSSYFENPSINVVVARGKVVNNEGQFIRYSRGTDIYNQVEKTVGMARIDQPETFFRKSVFDKITPLHEDLHYTMDLAMWIKYLLLYGQQNVQQVEDVVVNFRLHSDSKTMNYGDGFLTERDVLYKGILLKSGIILNDILKNAACESQEKIEWPDTDNINLHAVAQYYLMRLADEYYFSNERHKMSQILKIIDQTVLDKIEGRKFQKLKSRNHPIFFALKKCLKK
jgi:glycosyltransferase involved in cell wall biosynthesis